MAESFDEEMRRIWREVPLSINDQYTHLTYVDASHTLCGVPRTGGVLVTADLDQAGCPRCIDEHNRIMDTDHANENDAPEPDCNCNFCGDDYFEEESDASSPGAYCSEQCEIDEEEEDDL